MQTLTAADLMTSDVLTVRDDMTVAELAEFLTLHEISGAPVEDATGRLVGVVSITDIVRLAAEEDPVERERPPADYDVRGWSDRLDPSDLDSFRVHQPGALVREIMTEKILSVRTDASVSQMAETLIDARVHRLLVVDQGKLVGIISSTDLLGLLVEPSDQGVRRAS